MLMHHKLNQVSSWGRRRPCTTAHATLELKTNDYSLLALQADASSVRVSCKQTPLGRGLVCDSQVSPRTTLVSVPLSYALIVTDDPSNLSIFGDKSIDTLGESMGGMPQLLSDFLKSSSNRWDVRMMALFLWVKQKSASNSQESMWSLYFKTLPAEYDLSPLLSYRHDEEIETLQLPSLIQEAKEQREWIEHICQSVFSSGRAKGAMGELASLKLLPDDPDEALGQCFHAASLVRTRTFSEEMNGEPITLMVPFADLANHSFNTNARFCISPTDKSRFELRSIIGIDQNEEATISYGEEKTSAELFRDYGFICPGNPNDRIQLPNEIINNIRINGESLLLASGLRGIWTDSPDGLQDLTFSSDQDYDEARLGRLRSAILSLPLSDGYGGVIKGSAPPHDQRSNASSSGPASFFSSWFQSSSTSTSSSRPKPRSLPSNISKRSEAESIFKLRSAIQFNLHSLPTSLQEDQTQLSKLEKGPVPLNIGTILSNTRRKLQGMGPPSRSRLAAALRARIEYKTLQKEAIDLLDSYSLSLNNYP